MLAGIDAVSLFATEGRAMVDTKNNDNKRIRLEDVSKVWDGLAAVDQVTFDVSPGEFVILLGPSGCGKSTTLRMISGLEQTTAGRIVIGDRDVTREPPGNRGISMVFQSYALFPHLSVADNIVFGLRSRKVPKPQRQERLERVARMVGLEDYLDRKPAQLSGGQRQRVALARAIIAENAICLMDEPLSNLDARLRGDMRREIKALQQRLGMTVVYVTHDQVEAMSMGDRVILMHSGRIVQDGSPAELYNRPTTAFAASFIGSPAMNLIELEAMEGQTFIAKEPTVPIAWGDAGHCLLGLRPEDIVIQPSSAAGMPAQVIDEEYLGADTIVRVRVGNQTLRARLPGQQSMPSEHCRVDWPVTAAHFFTADSGERRDDIDAVAPATANSRSPISRDTAQPFPDQGAKR
ncbi:ABC transporter ATP-binding protein [Aidingimonas halophila]|nr:ABC transporter ATP-binding protein [Aidingimonas halophila]